VAERVLNKLRINWIIQEPWNSNSGVFY